VHTGSAHPLKQEMGLLRLCWDKAANRLKWRPAYNWVEALQETVDWFKAFQGKTQDMREVCFEHIQKYVERAAEQNIAWTKGSYVVSSRTA
jgi:CDP-glucose 4,6-dehydratase